MWPGEDTPRSDVWRTRLWNAFPTWDAPARAKIAGRLAFPRWHPRPRKLGRHSTPAGLPEPLRAPLEFAYLTGWRVPSEVLPLTWDRVDFAAQVVRLEVGTTKNREGRTFPFGALPDLKALLERQHEHTQTVQRRAGALVPWVFHRDGRRIKDFYVAWHAACRRAAVVRHGTLERVVRPALIGRVPHDFRRSAVRNLVRAGVPEHIAMKLTGHKTRDIFDRYDIVSERDLSDGVARLATFRADTAKRRTGNA